MKASARFLALSDMTSADIDAFLVEDETLFVEHKGNLAGEGVNVAKAVASFANGLGGWVLVGVTKGKLTSGQAGGWEAPPPGHFVDAVRQTLENHISPLPSFAATVRDHGEQKVGVIRVYESTDTPHILGGAIYVREVASARKVSKSGADLYEPRAVRNQELLLRLAQRGEQARQRATDLFWPHTTPWLARALRVTTTQAVGDQGVHLAWHTDDPAMVLRAAPLTYLPRMADWAVAEAGASALEAAVTRLTAGGASRDKSAGASGLSMAARTNDTIPLTDEASTSRDWHAIAGTDSAGVVGAKLGYGRRNPPRPVIEITLNGLRRILVEPLLREVAWLLEAGEFFGRAACHLVTNSLGEAFSLRHDGVTTNVASLAVGGDIVIPSGLEGPDDEKLPEELDALARQWVEDIARASGHYVLRGTYAD